MSSIPQTNTAQFVSNILLLSAEVHILIRNAGKQSSLCQAQCCSCRKQTREILDKTHGDTYYSPGDHDAGDPYGRSESLHCKIRWDLGCHVQRVEDGNGNLQSISYKF